MLTCEHLGGSEQHGLPSAVGQLQHRTQRNERLARAHLTLHQSIHRHGRGEVVLDLGAHRELVWRESERQVCIELIDKPAGNAWSRLRDPLSQGGTLLEQSRLKNEGLGEAQRLARSLPVGIHLRFVHFHQRLGQRHETALGPHISWHWVCHLGRHRQRELHRARNLPRGNS